MFYIINRCNFIITITQVWRALQKQIYVQCNLCPKQSQGYKLQGRAIDEKLRSINIIMSVKDNKDAKI